MLELQSEMFKHARCSCSSSGPARQSGPQMMQAFPCNSSNYLCFVTMQQHQCRLCWFQGIHVKAVSAAVADKPTRMHVKHARAATGLAAGVLGLLVYEVFHTSPKPYTCCQREELPLMLAAVSAKPCPALEFGMHPLISVEQPGHEACLLCGSAACLEACSEAC